MALRAGRVADREAGFPGVTGAFVAGETAGEQAMRLVVVVAAERIVA